MDEKFNSKNTRKISENDELLVQAYFDGEADVTEIAALKNRLNEYVLEDEFSGLRMLRNEMRSAYQAELAARPALDLWPAIAAELDKIQKESLSERLRFTFDQLGEQLNAFFSVRSIGLASAMTAALVLFMVQFGSRDASRSQNTLSASSGQSVGIMEVSSLDKDDRLNLPLSIPQSTRVSYRSRLVSGISSQYSSGGSQLIPELEKMSSGLIDNNFVLGGLRTEHMDIEYIKSKKKFRIVPAQNRSAPPVIWVAQKHTK